MKKDTPAAKIKSQLISNLSAQILLSNKCWPIAESKIGAFWGLTWFLINFGTCWRIHSSSRWDVLPTYTLLQWHEYLYTILLRLWASKTFFWKEDSVFFKEKIILADADPKLLLTVDFVCFSYLREIFPIQGNFKYTEHFSGWIAFQSFQSFTIHNHFNFSNIQRFFTLLDNIHIKNTSKPANKYFLPFYKSKKQQRYIKF